MSQASCSGIFPLPDKLPKQKCRNVEMRCCAILASLSGRAVLPAPGLLERRCLRADQKAVIDTVGLCGVECIRNPIGQARQQGLRVTIV